MSDRTPCVYLVERGSCQQGDHSVLAVFMTESAAQAFAADYERLNGYSDMSVTDYPLLGASALTAQDLKILRDAANSIDGEWGVGAGDDVDDVADKLAALLPPE